MGRPGALWHSGDRQARLCCRYLDWGQKARRWYSLVRGKRHEIYDSKSRRVLALHGQPGFMAGSDPTLLVLVHLDYRMRIPGNTQVLVG